MRLENLKLFDTLKGCSYELGTSTKANRYARNRVKLVKIYLNGKLQGYVQLDKTHRNLHIETEDENLTLKADY